MGRIDMATSENRKHARHETGGELVIKSDALCPDQQRRIRPVQLEFINRDHGIHS